MKYFKQFLGRIFEKFISYWTCFHSPHRSFSDTCVSQCTGYCDNRCPFFIRYFYSIACRQQWRRKENIAALRTCQAYTRVDRHMICSYKDCHPWRYFLQSSYTLSMMIVTSTSKRISGCPFMSVHISTRISTEWILPIIMSQSAGYTFSPSLDCAFVSLQISSPNSVSLI